jgi:cyclopropane fatty-acyl-phospholipid synthase-like methyltransferase
MVISAEALFNYLGRHYEDAYANSPHLCSTVKLVMEKLKPNSGILDMGCGTGKPVSYMLAAAGHKVYGIDVAQKMVDIAQQQVSGEFKKADMRTFKPNISFDAIFAVYSLFQISPSKTHAVVFKFAEWLNEDGILVLGVTPSTSLPPSTGVHDTT